MSETVIHKAVAAARGGTNPTVIARLRSGWAVAGLTQVIEGATVIIYDDGTTEIRPPLQSKTAKTGRNPKATTPKVIKPATKPSTTTKTKR